MSPVTEAKPSVEFVYDPNTEFTYTNEFIEPSMILGSLVGPTRTHPDGEISTGNKKTLYLREPRHTVYILVQRSDGQLEVNRWNADIHPPIDDIAPIGGAIGEFMDQIEGMGEMGEPFGFRFRQVTRAPGTAMHTFDSVEKATRQRGGNPDYPIDKSGSRALENNGFRILFPAASFAFDASRRTIDRILPDEDIA